MEAEERLKDFSLESGRKYRYLRIPGERQETKIKYCRDEPVSNIAQFRQFEQDLIALEFTPDLLETIYRILAGIMILGEIRFKDTDNLTELEDPEIVTRVANLLKLDEKKFQWALLNYCVVIRGSAERRRHSPDEARDARDVLAATIYSRLVDWIVNTVNQKLTLSRAIYGDLHSITLTDHFGFECFHRNHIDQLMVNSLNEQMQYLYNQRMFVFEMVEQEEEQVPVTALHYYDNKMAVDHIMNKPKGIFSIIDDASRGRHGQNYIIETIHSTKSPFIKRATGHEFTIAHYTGRVTYDARDIADKNRDFIPPEMVETLRSSNEDVIKVMFSNQLSRTGNLTMSVEETTGVTGVTQKKKKKWGAALLAEKQKSKKINTLSRGQYSQVHKMRTLASVFRATGLEIFKALSIGANSGGTHFVRCIRADLEYKELNFQDDMVRQQLRAMAILDTARARQQGFSHRISFSEFLRRYQFLAFDFEENVEITKENCRLLLIRLKLEGWVIGRTKVFLKYYNVEYLSRLYETQVKKIVKVQSMMRAFLAKRNVATQMKKLHRESVKKQQSEDTTTEEAAIRIQTVYRGHMARKKYCPLINEKTGKLDQDTLDFIRDFAIKWRSKSIYQVLLQYRAARYQELVCFSQQVHIFNQRSMAGLTAASNCILIDRIDPNQRNASLLGPIKPPVWKLRFRLDEIPFFDTAYMCDPSLASHIYTNGNDSDTEEWDAPLRRRKNLSSEITMAVSRGKEQYCQTESVDYTLANEPFHRDPSIPIKKLSPRKNVNDYPTLRNPVSPTNRMSPVYSPIPYGRQLVNDIKDRHNDPICQQVSPSKTPVYKKRQAPRAPFIEEYISSPIEFESKSLKKRPAPQPVKQWEPKPRPDYQFEKKSASPSKINPIREMELIGKKIADDNDNSEDDPPFNFQGLLRKTNKHRASMKRSTEDNAFSVAANIDFEDENSNISAASSVNRIRSTETSVVYQSKNYDRPKSCYSINGDADIRRMSPTPRKPSLSHDTMMGMPPMEYAAVGRSSRSSRTSRSPSPFDMNQNTFIQEEIAPGIIVEGYVADL